MAQCLGPRRIIGESFNGRTSDSDSENLGSNPGSPASRSFFQTDVPDAAIAFRLVLPRDDGDFAAGFEDGETDLVEVFQALLVASGAHDAVDVDAAALHDT